MLSLIHIYQVYDGIIECLSTLKKQGKLLALATSKPEVFAKEIMDYYHLSTYFDFIGGSEFYARETKHEVIEYVLNEMKIDRDNAIMVGDRKHDVVGADVYKRQRDR